MDREKDIKLRLLEATAKEEEEIAKIFAILNEKLGKTLQWLPDKIECLPPEKAIEMAIKLEKTISREILALAKKEKAIIKKIDVVNKKIDKKDVCKKTCPWVMFCEFKDINKCPFIKC